MKNPEELDQLLDRQKGVHKLVRDLPEDTVSLAWRSQLNEAIRAQSPARRPFLSWVWKPAVMVAVAGALMFAVIVKLPNRTTAPSTPTEAEIAIAAHEASVTQLELGYAFGDSTGEAPLIDSWEDEVDLSAL